VRMKLPWDQGLDKSNEERTTEKGPITVLWKEDG
jgi:hypothetical protein